MDNLQLDGNARVDYLVETKGSAVDAVPPVVLSGVDLRNANVTAVDGYNGALLVEDCAAY